ncbi:hypothetical protein [Streptomyces sp. NPDC048340]|uniref:hypothetical protein n=1 Tax=Streptomyces sp. NPDC048340 TaxID=3365537 RepID=UPI003723F062
MVYDPSAMVIVPVRTSAIIVNASVQSASKTFYRWEPRFSGREPTVDPEPPPFAPDNEMGQRRARGVYLSFQVPQALLQGRLDFSDTSELDATAEPEFPFLPTRWLIVRYFRAGRHPDPGARPEVAAWVVESDYVSQVRKGPNAASSRYLRTGRDGKPQPCYIGRHHDLGSGPWQERNPVPEPFLTVMGPGLESFAAFQPYNKDVLSFHDQLARPGQPAGSLPEGTLSYLVAGWHAHPDGEPFAPRPAADLLAFHGRSPGRSASAVFREVLDALEWELPTGGPARRAVYMGTALGVSWAEGEPSCPKNEVTTRPLKVAVGHDSSDALAALLNDTRVRKEPGIDPDVLNDEAVDLFHALDISQLGTPDTVLDDGREAVAHAGHARWFSSVSGGHAWRFVTASDSAKPPPEPVPPYLHQELTALNDLQRELDENERLAQALGHQLHDLWWRRARKDEVDPVGEAEYRSAMARLRSGRELRDRLHTATSDRAAELAALLPPGQRLETVPLPEFHRAGDPHVQLAGALLGTAPDLPDEDRLTCRWPKDLITALKPDGLPRLKVPKGTDNAHHEAKQLAAKAQAGAQRIPDPVLTRMLGEFHLLDTAAVQVLATVTGGGGTVPWRRRETAWTKACAPWQAPGSGTLTGRWPALTRLWNQHWQPLFLLFDVTCWPLPYATRTGGVLSRHWRFTGERHTLSVDQAVRDYADRHKTTVTGRCFLGPTEVFALRQLVGDQIASHTTTSGTRGRLEKFRRQVASWDLVSQALADAGMWLTQHMPGHTADVLPPAERELMPERSAEVPTPPGTPKACHPVPAYQFAFNKLVVVDMFGQSVDALPRQGGDSMHLIRSPRLTAPQPVGRNGGDPQPKQTVAQVEPRLPQPARLRVEGAHQHPDPAGHIQLVDLYADPSLGIGNTPVIGWLLAHRRRPDELDPGALAVFGPTGEPLGDLALIGPGASGKAAVGWLPRAHSPYRRPADVLDSAFAREHPHLAQFLRPLLDADADERVNRGRDAGRKPDRFRDLMAAVNQSALTVTPPAAHAGTTLPVLPGRVLALVRAAVHLELDGPPLPHHTPKPTDRTLLDDAAFSVRLGEGGNLADGLVGYFCTSGGASAASGATDYSTLRTVNRPARRLSTYLGAVAPDRDITVRARPAAAARHVAPEAAAAVTLLMDPWAQVHAHSGILPRTAFRLPLEGVHATLSRLQIALPVGPVLATRRLLTAPAGAPHAPRTAVLLPHPTVEHGPWELVERSATGWLASPLIAPDPAHHPQDPVPALCSGHLVLTPGPEPGLQPAHTPAPGTPEDLS